MENICLVGLLGAVQVAKETEADSLHQGVKIQQQKTNSTPPEN